MSDALAGPSALDVAVELLGLSSTDGTRPDRSAAPGQSFGAVAIAGRARFLLPLGWPAATQAACLSYLGLRSATTRFTRRVVASALRVGARDQVVPYRYVADGASGGLLAHLAAQLGQPEVAVAMGLGRVDPVWKPTLQVFSPGGSPLAFVKIGRGPVASELVGREAAALARWADHPDPRLAVPGLIGTSVWREMPMVLAAPLPRDARRLPAPVSPWPVRALDAPLADTPLSGSRWWSTRRAAAAGHSAAEGQVGALLERIEACHDGPRRSWARWHGDWVPWNLARCHLGLVAWDWEYSEPGAPVGLDETHGHYQRLRVGRGRPVAEALAATRAAAPSSWLADAHLAMLLTRNADLTRLGGATPGDDAEIRRFAEAVGP